MPIFEPEITKTYIIDIETEPKKEFIKDFEANLKAPSNYKDEEKIKAYLEEAKKGVVKDMSVDVDYCEIKLIGVMDIATQEIKHITLKELDELLSSQPRIISYNGKNFDISIIIRALLRAGLTKNVKWLKESCVRYKTYPQVDLMEAINEFGKYKSLDTLAKIYIGEGKTEIDFATCSMEELIKHNEECLRTTFSIFQFFKPII